MVSKIVVVPGKAVNFLDSSMRGAATDSCFRLQNASMLSICCVGHLVVMIHSQTQTEESVFKKSSVSTKVKEKLTEALVETLQSFEEEGRLTIEQFWQAKCRTNPMELPRRLLYGFIPRVGDRLELPPNQRQTLKRVIDLRCQGLRFYLHSYRKPLHEEIRTACVTLPNSWVQAGFFSVHLTIIAAAIICGPEGPFPAGVNLHWYRSSAHSLFQDAIKAARNIPSSDLKGEDMDSEIIFVQMEKRNLLALSKMGVPSQVMSWAMYRTVYVRSLLKV